MEWNAEAIDRLYVLYQEHHDRLQSEVAATNRTLGSANPEKSELPRLTCDQFAAILADSTTDPKAVLLWVRRIIRGHEREFQLFQAAG